MFDNVKPPEDIFAGTETGAVPPPPANLPMAPSTPISSVSEVESSPRGRFPWKPIVITLGAIAVIGGAAGISYALLASRSPAAPEEPEPVVAASTSPATTVQVPAVTTPSNTTTTTPPATTPTPAPTAAPDRDKDGLSDAEESTLGTSPTSADTDADGLFDKEEGTYGTDPLNPDTDGDTYLDGAEVKGGYNPNGPGKLFEVPNN